MGSNFGSKILNNAAGSMLAQQAVIATTANNIQNANTPGYARRTATLQTQMASGGGDSLSVGSGVVLSGISRTADQYVERLLREATRDKFGAETQDALLDRMQRLFSLSDDAVTVGSTLTAFNTALTSLAADPSSIERRSTVIERGSDLVNAIRSTFNALANLQEEANARVATEVQSINSLTAQIADLNMRISGREAAGGVAADERDNRDILVQQLAEKIGFTATEQSDGSITISLDKGFPLVQGTNARALQVTSSPSFASGSVPASLSGGVLGYVVYDFDTGSGTSHVDLTQALQGKGGVLGALLDMRGYADPSNTSPFQANGSIVEVAARVEGLARQLLTVANARYLGADEDGVTAGHQPSSGDLDGNTPTTYGLFSFDFLGVKDVNGDGLPNDLDSLPITNFANLLTFNVTQPRKFAAARDSNPSSAATAFASGDNRNVLGLTDLMNETLSFSAGSYSFSGTFEQAYNETVTRVGGLKARAATNASVSAANLVSAQGRRDETSGVSIDEEYANLIKFQKAFEASARLIRVAQQLLDEIVGLI